MYSTPSGVSAEFTVYPGKKKEIQMEYTQNASEILAVIQSLCKVYSTTRYLALFMVESNSN